MILIEGVEIIQEPMIQMNTIGGEMRQIGPGGEMTARLNILVSGSDMDALGPLIYDTREDGLISGQDLLSLFGIKDINDKVEIKSRVRSIDI